MAITPVQGKQIATASWAVNAISSSYAATASYALNAGTTINTGSFVTTSSFNSFTSSYNTGSFTGSFTGSLLGTSSFAVSSSRAITSSFAISSSYALSSSFAVSSSRAVTSSFAISASQAQSAISASYSTTSLSSSFASTSLSSSYASSSTSASYATTAGAANTISAAITNNVDNYVLTATGTGVINGETNLTFDGVKLKATGKVQQGDNSTFADGAYSHVEGRRTTTLTEYSHAEGTDSFTGQYGYLADSIRDTYTLQISRDVANQFLGGYIIYDDTKYANIYGVVVLPYSSVTYSSTTDIVLNQDVSSGFTGALIGIPGLSNPADSTHTLDFNAIASHAEGSGTIADGEASHAEGRGSTSIGNYSHAEGSGSQAIAQYSHTEGRGTKAFGSGSHAEGIRTFAINSNSHTEGSQTYTGQYAYECAINDKSEIYTNARYGDVSSQFTSAYLIFDDTTTGNANGLLEVKVGSVTWTGTQVKIVSETTVAQSSKGYVGVGGVFAPSKAYDFIPLSKISSHAEGDSTFALGEGSHAEGSSTRTTGDYSSTKGIGTIAQGHYQTVIGKYNIPSRDSGYTLIVGNGTSDSARSNALTISSSVVTIPGTLQVTGGVTGSLSGTASYSNNAATASVLLGSVVSASYALTASYAMNGGGSTPTFPYSGSAVITGSLLVSSSLTVTGSLRVSGSITGSLFGTSSWATSASVAPLYLPLAGGNMTGTLFGSGRTFQFQDLVLGYGTTFGTIKTDGTKYIGIYPTNAVESTRFLANGSVIFGTTFTDSGYRLQVSASGAASGALQVIGTSVITGSLTVTQGITGSLFGTSSWAISSSNAATASYALTSSYSVNQVVSGSISNVDYIDFNTGSATPAWKSGRIFWDNTEQSLAVYNSEADVTLNVGQENWTRVWNASGATIHNGDPVRISGTHGDVPQVVLAQSIAVSGSANLVNQVLGLATHDIEVNTFGFITTQGLIHGLNTSAHNDGDTLYVSQTAGVLTNTQPPAPYEIIPVGQVVKASPGASGIVYAAVQQPIDFSDLSSVRRTGVDYVVGDLWTYVTSGSTNVWVHGKQLSGSYGVTGSINISGGITGSLFGTASFANTASYVQSAQSASYVLQAVSSSYAATASYTLNAGTSINTGSFVTTSSFNLYTGSSASQFAGTASFVSTASFVNRLNQNVIITGSLVVGSGSVGVGENTLVVGPAPSGGAGEGGQVLLSAPGGGYDSASMFDNYQNRTRLLRGTNAGSDAEVASWNMHTKQMALTAYNSGTSFSGNTIASLGVDSGGNITTVNYYNYKNSTTSSIVTGSVTETQVLRVTIPANTFSTTDVFKIPVAQVNKTGTAGNCVVKFKLSTSSTLPAGTTNQIAAYTINAAQNSGFITRNLIVGNGSIYGYTFTTTSPDGLGGISNPISSGSFDPTVLNYFYVSLTNGSAADATYLNGISITNI